MKKGENTNHPKPGDEIRVEPVKAAKDIKAIKKLLATSPRDYALFTLGINTNLRASDLLRLTVGQVRNVKPMDEIEMKERKTGKRRRISLNKSCVDAIHALLKSRLYSDDEPIFSGQRGPLTVPSVNRLVKQWCRIVNLKGNYGSHSLRKTWGYHQRVTFGRGLPELMVCFNHSSERQTLDYLCVQPEEIKSIYANEL
ncbi:MAG: tyrosine-type recombinase/integrase [Syntrophobacteraceae bacterium]